MTATLNQVVQGGSINAGDVNQLVQACTGLLLVSPGPMVQLATQSINTTVASVTFSNIPAYNNLFLTWQARSNNASLTVGLQLQINGNSTSNYYYQALSGSNTTASASSAQGGASLTLGTVAAASAGSGNMTGWGFASIPNWSVPANLTNVQSVAGYITGTAAGGMATELRSGTFALTATGTSLKFSLTAGSFAGTVTTCLFTLYGSM
jgi:hypothetical protein